MKINSYMNKIELYAKYRPSYPEECINIKTSKTTENEKYYDEYILDLKEFFNKFNVNGNIQIYQETYLHIGKIE